MNLDALATLSPREADCLRLVAQLRTDKEIARQLGIEPSTVKTHVARAMKKLDVPSRSVAARAFSQYDACPPRWGIVPEGGQPVPITPPIPVLSGDRQAVDVVQSDDIADHVNGTWIGPGRPMVGIGRQIHMSMLQRAVLIAVGTLAMAIAAIAALPLSDAVQRLADRIAPRHSR